LVEDKSLHFHALGGMPGPYIKWFQDSLQSTGLYNILAAYENKSATAVCTLAFCPSPHADPILFTGECHGQIVEPVSGRGFGWDSIFVPDALACSDRPFSLMSVEEKNEHSHRGKAVRRWAEWLGNNRDALWERQEKKEHIPGHKGLNFKVGFSEQ
jgi:inosine triphosphate pyrophosphatase